MVLIPVFFFNDTATTEIYTLSLHDALPIGADAVWGGNSLACQLRGLCPSAVQGPVVVARSEEHTSELQSRRDLVCRLLLEKKKKIIITLYTNTLNIKKKLS